VLAAPQLAVLIQIDHYLFFTNLWLPPLEFVFLWTGFYGLAVKIGSIQSQNFLLVFPDLTKKLLIKSNKYMAWLY